MKKLLAQFVFLLLVLAPLCAQAKTLYLSFNECVEMALKNNDQIRANMADILLSEAKSQEAYPKGIPVLKYEHRIAPVPKDIDNAAESFFGGDISVFNNVKVEFGSAITTFGKIKTAQELAAMGIDASWFQRDKTASDLIYKIYQVYQGIVLARELLKLAEQGQNALNDKIEGMKKDKVVDQISILKMKLALFEVERKVEEAKQKKELAFAALRVQIGVERETKIDIKTSSLSMAPYSIQPLEHYLDLARHHRAEFKLLGVAVAAKEKKVKLESLNYAPNFGIGGFVDVGRAPGVVGNQDENTFTNPFNFTKAGLGFQLKGEFDYVKTSSKVKQAKADLLKSVYEKRAATKGIELDIQQAYLSIKSAKSLVQKSEEELKTARQLLFLTKSNLDIGVGDKKEYYDTLQSYLIFQGRQFEAIYNYNVAIYELKKKVGTLAETPGRRGPLSEIKERNVHE